MSTGLPLTLAIWKYDCPMGNLRPLGKSSTCISIMNHVVGVCQMLCYVHRCAALKFELLMPRFGCIDFSIKMPDNMIYQALGSDI